MKDTPDRRRKIKRWSFRLLPAVPVLLGAYAFLVEPYWIQLTRHDVGEGDEELKILHLTDLHFTTFGRLERRVLEIIKETSPDLIVITGDSILRDYRRDEFTEFLSRLSAPRGIYACPGNWEDWVGDSVYECYERAGVRLLDDRAAMLENGVELVGVSTAISPVPSRGDVPLRIVLCHYPVILPEASRQGADLVFTGHTHGGQVRLPFIGALHTPFDSGDYEAGWYREGDCRMYVSRGVGTSILPVRFLCRPEAALHRVRFSR